LAKKKHIKNNKVVMPQTGIPTETECISEFNAMKLKKEYSFITYGMDKDFSKIQIIDKGAATDSYDDFVSKLPLDECRYAVVNVKFSLENDGDREKLLFISWSPNKAKLKSKMLFASSKEDFRKQLVGASLELQANGAEDVTFECALAKCTQFSK
jgi:cofilin